MEFLSLKSTFFVVINRLKTLEIISVILRLWQVVATISASVSAAASESGPSSHRGHRVLPMPWPCCQWIARNSGGHKEVGFVLLKDKIKN